MSQVLIIADDFTGALDTGVYLATAGAKVKVVTDPTTDLTTLAGEAQALVVDAETRHLSPQEAYATVKSVVEQAVAMGIPHIYKKTDSALRGNIGAELTALLDASGEKQLAFLPAFPRLRRLTKEGVHYIDGVPVAESVFGADPFEPVPYSELPALIGVQSEAPVHLAKPGEETEAPGIVVYDAQTEEDLEVTGAMLARQGKLHILAGCAGFGAMLPSLLGIGGGTPPTHPPLDERLLVVCGSVNPITVDQLDMAEQAGFARFRLTPRQKLEEGYWQTEEGRSAAQALRSALERYPQMIVDSNDAQGNQLTAAYAKKRGLTLEEVRVRISQAVGYVVSALFSSPALGTLMVTGGDTLLQCMEIMAVNELEPVCELTPGVVLSRFTKDGYTRYVISKSGGFGERTLLRDLREQIKHGR